MISTIDLNLLLVLHTVLEERNVARAAQRLHVTPSAVSNSLARLRGVVGDPLVTRKGRGIVPTPRAAELAPAVARALRELEVALSSKTFDAQSCTRAFTLAVADLGQIMWVPRLAEAMRRKLPLASLRVVGIDALIALGDLASSEVDLQVGMAAKGPGIHAEPLFEERSMLVARKAHPQAGRRLSRGSLAELRHVRVEMVPGKNFRDPLAALFARAGVDRKIAVTVPSFSAAAEVVAASDLVTMLPASFIVAKGAALGLRTMVVPLPEHSIALAMCWHERTHADAAARAFRAIVRDVIAEVRGKRVN